MVPTPPGCPVPHAFTSQALRRPRTPPLPIRDAGRGAAEARSALEIGQATHASRPLVRSATRFGARHCSSRYPSIRRSSTRVGSGRRRCEASGFGRNRQSNIPGSPAPGNLDRHTIHAHHNALVLRRGRPNKMSAIAVSQRRLIKRNRELQCLGARISWRSEPKTGWCRCPTSCAPRFGCAPTASRIGEVPRRRSA